MGENIYETFDSSIIIDRSQKILTKNEMIKSNNNTKNTKDTKIPEFNLDGGVFFRLFVCSYFDMTLFEQHMNKYFQLIPQLYFHNE